MTILKLLFFRAFVCGLSTEGAVAVFHHLKSIGKKENLLPSGDDIIGLVDLTETQENFLQWFFDFLLMVDCKEAILGTFLECVNGVVLLGYSYNWSLLDPSVLLMLLHHESFILLLIKIHELFVECFEESWWSALNQIDTKVVTTFGVFHVTTSALIKKFASDYSRILLLKKSSDFYIGFQKVYIEDLVNLITDLLQSSLASEQSESEIQVSQQKNSQNFNTQKQADALENTSFHFLLLTIDVWNYDFDCDSLGLGFARYVQHGTLSKNIKVLLSELNCAMNLCHIELAGLGISWELAESLAMVLDHVPCLEILRLSNNPLGCGVSVLACHLQGVPRLSCLQLNKTSMTEREAADLANSLQHVPLLKELSLSNNPIGCGLIPLVENLIHIPQLRSLMLDKTNMTEREAAGLAKVLQHVPLLEELGLSNNPIGCGLIPLAENLIHVPQLRCLMLDNTNMTEREAADLAKALQHVPLHKVLSLEDNPIAHAWSHPSC